MIPAAPPRLSTTNCCPTRSPIFCVRMRATMSLPPPGGHGTIIRTGFTGYVWACSVAAGASSAASAAPKARLRAARSTFISLLLARRCALTWARGRHYDCHTILSRSPVSVDLKVEPQTVQIQTANKLRDAILSGYFKPGQRLVEADLCEMMQVSRTSIREALRRLE